jgi:hypothetical protein
MVCISHFTNPFGISSHLTLSRHAFFFFFPPYKTFKKEKKNPVYKKGRDQNPSTRNTRQMKAPEHRFSTKDWVRCIY